MAHTSHNELSACIEGIGLLGPGLDGWGSAAMLAGHSPYISQPTVVPIPEGLPAAERRRVGKVVRVALAVGRQAVASAGIDPGELASVFSSSGGDGDNCHEICQALAKDERLISPTRFHNSVHNAASGYWSIATGSTASSNVLCAFDASFAAGLLESITQAVVERQRVLLVAYDVQYPPPLFAKRPICESFGVALVLSPERTPAALARLSLQLSDTPPERLANPELESLRACIPAARSLPMLCALARHDTRAVALDYLDGHSLLVDVEPCR